MEDPDNRSQDIAVQFYSRHTKIAKKLVSPKYPDMAVVPETDIKMIFPKPNQHGKTKIQLDLISFEISFSNMEVC